MRKKQKTNKETHQDNGEVQVQPCHTERNRMSPQRCIIVFCLPFNHRLYRPSQWLFRLSASNSFSLFFFLFSLSCACERTPRALTHFCLFHRCISFSSSSSSSISSLFHFLYLGFVSISSRPPSSPSLSSPKRNSDILPCLCCSKEHPTDMLRVLQAITCPKRFLPALAISPCIQVIRAKNER